MQEIKILFYNQTVSEYWYFRHEDFPPGYTLMTDPALLDIADVVVFFLPTLKVGQDIEKREGQIWVAWSTECEQHYPQYEDPDISRLFDLRMGYYRHYDIFTPYVYPRYEEFLRLCDGMQPKGGGIGMFISSPFNLSKRFDYLNELGRYLPIDSYGRQMRNRRLQYDFGPASKKIAVSQYKFTIAFENSIGDDYVTEKFYEPLIMGSLPVYLGAPNVSEYAPGEHCYIDVRDYGSPKELAEYLHYLLLNPEAYNAYFEWKKRPYTDSFRTLLDRVARPVALRLVEALERHPAFGAVRSLNADLNSATI